MLNVIYINRKKEIKIGPVIRRFNHLFFSFQINEDSFVIGFQAVNSDLGINILTEQRIANTSTLSQKERFFLSRDFLKFDYIVDEDFRRAHKKVFCARSGYLHGQIDDPHIPTNLTPGVMSGNDDDGEHKSFVRFPTDEDEPDPQYNKYAKPIV